MSHFTVEHKGNRYRCNKATHERNLGTSYKEHGVIKCIDEDISTRKFTENTPANACANIVYHYGDCDQLTFRYHTVCQVYYKKLYYICELYPQHQSKWKVLKDEEYTDESIDDFIADLTSLINQNDIGVLYNAKLHSGENAHKWKDLMICIDELTMEILLRKRYKDDCTCIRDKKHNVRINKCETLLAKLETLKQQYLQYDCPETQVRPPNQFHQFLMYATMSKEDVIKIFNFCMKSKLSTSESSTFRTIKTLVYNAVNSAIQTICATKKEYLPWPPEENSKKILHALLYKELGEFVNMHWDFVMEVCREYVYSRLNTVFEDVVYYYTNGISCITYDQMKPSGIRIDYVKFKKSIETKYGITMPIDVIENYVNTHVHDQSYRTCLQSWYANQLQIIVDLCTAMKENPNLGDISRRRIAQTFCDIEHIRDALKDVVAKDPKGYQSIWSGKNIRGLQYTLDDGSRPTYKLAKDMSKMTMIAISMLLWLYKDSKKHNKNGEEESSTEDDEEREPKRQKRIGVILFK